MKTNHGQSLLMKVRRIAAIWVGKLLIFAGIIFDKQASSRPGRAALKICPELLGFLSGQITGKKVCVLGTNGKTTTNNMIDTLLMGMDKQTVCNSTGANMPGGVVTAFLKQTSLWGKISCAYSAIEIDEAYAKIVFEHLVPDVIVVTNVFRDQLDRYGEIDITLEHIKRAIALAPHAKLILNVDDPLCGYLATCCENEVITYGVNEKVFEPLEETKEGQFCKCCGTQLDYQYYHYSQLGDYACTECGFKRAAPDFGATEVKAEGKISFLLNGTTKIQSNTYGIYNIYNMLAAIAAMDALDMEITDYSGLFSLYRPQVARMEEFSFEKPVILNLSKNPAGFNQAIEAVNADPREKAVVIGINDLAADGRDVSWLYDVDFERLAGIKMLAVSGSRAYDMALRLYYAEVCDAPAVDRDPVVPALKFLQSSCEVVYILVNYTLIYDVDRKLRRALKKWGRDSDQRA